IRSQLFHCRHDADTFGPARDVPDSSLEPFQRFRRDRALDVRTSRKAEPEELPFLRSCHRTLCLVDLELELSRDEARDALHHPLARTFTADVKCYNHPHSERSDAHGARAPGRVHRAGDYLAVAKVGLLA